MKFITDVLPGESVILAPSLIHCLLQIVDLFDNTVVIFEYTPPAEGWTHENLCALDIPLERLRGADAYLGETWVGSTEI
ncbi:hypothetical protein E4188_23150 (plasmid) [Aeromonas media]|uniref:Mannose-6-phosphate isomerase n=2 Tax=Aeromonas TaxID=642 RepID=A0ABX6NYE1_AERME|nr:MULTISPECIES: hypothetical protein [Aeromonas]ASI21398.1 hypothetical protein CE456_00715 [Aeromonas salmonicida]QJT41399.1 hypothetical protein E4188_23150 [Aeromonas media]QLI59211.1 hypothetical protein C0708_23030 [Aeromonas caviae]QLI60441.1 hypothetical protein C1C91_22680 [Aeromonas caviae]HDN9374633.1 hypothetical protein [Aeromonas salmonicida]